MSVFEKIKTGLEEAIAYEEGKLTLDVTEKKMSERNGNASVTKDLPDEK